MRSLLSLKSPPKHGSPAELPLLSASNYSPGRATPMTSQPLRLKLLASIAIILATAVAHADPVVYVTNLFQQFGTVNLATGSFQTIGSGLSEANAGLVSGPAGSLL